MRVSSINNFNFKQIIETSRKDCNKEENDDSEVYEATVTYTETIKVPKKSETLQKIDYMV